MRPSSFDERADVEAPQYILGEDGVLWTTGGEEAREIVAANEAKLPGRAA